MAESHSESDARTDEMKTEMAQHFAEFEADYREGDFGEVVYEDSEAVVVADHVRHELNEWSDWFDVSRSELSETMHTLARDLMGETEAHDVFSTADPVVFDKFEESNGGDA